MSGGYLLEQLKLHPSVQAQDVVKMCFQSAFGAEHMISDPRAAEAYLKRELDETPAADIPLAEDISDTHVRVNLAAWKYRRLPAETLLAAFLETGKPVNEGFEALMKGYMEALEEAGCTDLARELSEYLKGYYEGGIRAVHHSEIYRLNESPHYRVVSREALMKHIRQ